MKILSSLFFLTFFASQVLSQRTMTSDSIVTLFMNGQYDAVKKKSRETIQHQNDTRETWYLLGKVYETQYNYDSAVICFKRALEYDSADVKVLNSLGISYLGNRRLSKASEVYRLILSIQPENKDATVNLANILSRLGNDIAAKNLYTLLVASDSSNSYFLCQLAACYHAINMNDSAVYFYEKCLKINPEDFPSLIKLAGLFLKTGAFQKGLELTGKYIGYDSLNVPALKLNAYFCLLLNSPDSAISQFSKCMELGDTSFMTAKYTGLAYFKKEDMYEAAEYLNKAYLLDSTDVETLMYLGISTGWTINKGKGIEYLKKVMDMIFPADETVVRVYRETGDLYAAWSKPDEAIGYYMKILDYNTDNRLILFKLGSSFEQIDKLAALNWYNEFMKTRDPGAGPVTTNSEGLFVVSYYEVAAQKITKLREELFFEGKIENRK